MTYLFPLALRSAWNRRYTLLYTVVSIALATLLLTAIDRIRQDVRTSFEESVSGTDLLVGSRASPLQLLLYAVFHVGEASQNMLWTSAERIAAMPSVAWTIPLSLGDTHRGFPVLATSAAYFQHFRYGDGAALRLASGRPFDSVFEAVLGSEVAHKTGYRLGQEIVLTHGAGAMLGAEHADKPFTVVGILAATGTPVDRTVHIGLDGMEAIHLDWQAGAPLPGFSIPASLVRKFDLTPKSITALLVGLKQRAAVFGVQRQLAAFADEPLMGVMPGVALDQLWEVLGQAERALLLISWLVALVSIGSLVAVVLAGLDARRRELAILRSVGARPRELLLLLALEGFVVTLLGVALGVCLLLLALGCGAPLLEAHYGIALTGLRTDKAAVLDLLRMCAWVLSAGSVASLIPGWRAYSLSLSDGLTPRL